MKDMQNQTIRRVVVWGLSLGFVSALLAAAASTSFDARDWEDIGIGFMGGCLCGCLLGMLTTTYNQKRKSLFYIWGWALLLGSLGTLVNAYGLRAALIGGLAWASVGAMIGLTFYWLVLRYLGKRGLPERDY